LKGNREKKKGTYDCMPKDLRGSEGGVHKKGKRSMCIAGWKKRHSTSWGRTERDPLRAEMKKTKGNLDEAQQAGGVLHNAGNWEVFTSEARKLNLKTGRCNGTVETSFSKEGTYVRWTGRKNTGKQRDVLRKFRGARHGPFGANEEKRNKKKKSCHAIGQLSGCPVQSGKGKGENEQGILLYRKTRKAARVGELESNPGGSADEGLRSRVDAGHGH